MLLFIVPVRALGGDLSMSYQYDSTDLVSASWELYRVSVESSGDLVHTSNFSNVSVSANLARTDYGTYVDTVDNYITANSITPDVTGKTDSNGEVDYTISSDGVYLVRFGSHIQDDVEYSSSPILFQIQSDDIDLNPKVTAEKIEDTTTVTVNKTWRDDQLLDVRPSQILVGLYENGTRIESVVLSSSNNWAHTWEDLDAKSAWAVLELSETSGYLATYVKNENQFNIINTYQPVEQPEEPEIPEDPEDPGNEEDSGTPENPDQSDSLGQSDTGNNIPSTGTLNWPIPVLVVIGLLSLGLGVMLRRDPKEGE